MHGCVVVCVEGEGWAVLAPVLLFISYQGGLFVCFSVVSCNALTGYWNAFQ